MLKTWLPSAASEEEGGRFEDLLDEALGKVHWGAEQ
jgi:hypothetical protein